MEKLIENRIEQFGVYVEECESVALYVLHKVRNPTNRLRLYYLFVKNMQLGAGQISSLNQLKTSWRQRMLSNNDVALLLSGSTNWLRNEFYGGQRDDGTARDAHALSKIRDLKTYGEVDLPSEYILYINYKFKDIAEKLAREDTTIKYTSSKIPIPQVDRQQRIEVEDHPVYILHLSDIHLQTSSDAFKYYTQLAEDLKIELNVTRLRYLVISGDIGCYSTPDEYEAAYVLIDQLVKHFKLDYRRIVSVPGNHDLNHDKAKEAYKEAHNGDKGYLTLDEALYRERFANFSAHFYKKINGGKSYPLDYAEQGILHQFPDDRILFLALNSCWEIDHHYKDRANINIDALSNALYQVMEGKFDDWLKIAVWHHPVTGSKAMKSEFMERLSTQGFEICMHGHIHEAIEDYHKYDDRRGIHVVGAGTFGAQSNEQVSGIPLQYNLLILDPENYTITVETRKKEKRDGAWSADARWVDKNNPRSSYIIDLKTHHNQTQRLMS